MLGPESYQFKHQSSRITLALMCDNMSFEFGGLVIIKHAFSV